MTESELATVRTRVKLATEHVQTQRSLWLEHYQYDVPRLLAEIERLREIAEDANAS